MARWRAELRVTCIDCGREGRFNADDIARWFRGRNWSTALEAAPHRFKCSGFNGEGCGGRNIKLGAHMPDPQLPPSRPMAKPGDGSDAPAGIDQAQWDAADARERKRLVQRLRG